MASFVKLNSENKVIKAVSISNSVITDVNGVEQESLGIEFLRNLYNEPEANWKQTSYNTRNNIHTNGGVPIRGNYAGLGYIYDSIHNVFYSEKPYPSYILNTSKWLWEAPIPKPEGNFYPVIWDEETLSWITDPRFEGLEIPNQ
jgi:hypothetical protein